MEVMTDIQWLIGGEAGYGIMTTGVTMAKIFTRLGLSVFDYVEYPSLIRGGHNAYYVRGADLPIYSQKKTVDILVALNRETIDLHKDELAPDAVIIYDSNSVKVQTGEFGSSQIVIPIPLIDFIKELGVERLMVNTIALGASVPIFYDSHDVLQQIIHDTFKEKGDEIVLLNSKTSEKGFDFVQHNFPQAHQKRLQKKQQTSLLISGAESVAFGAIQAGLKFAAIYPMTPINGITVSLTDHALAYGIIIKEPEDEIAGINMAIGASYAGVRSMVATAGGGFALMSEGLGLAAQAEVPLVIVMGMRPGPSTGMPTWTDQGDLRFVLHTGQGDFPRIVVAPGDLEEAFTLTMDAFNLAEVYQLSVIILVDKYLMEGHATLSHTKLVTHAKQYKIARGKLIDGKDLQGEKDYKRYVLVNDGVSPRALPGQEGGINLTGSDEHDQRGLYNEERNVRIAMMAKRFLKLDEAEKMIPLPKIIGVSDALITLIFFGSTKLPALDAMEVLKKENIAVNLLQVTYLNPFPTEMFKKLVKTAQKTLIIEENFTGQLEGLIKEKTGFTPTDRLRKYDGRPFYFEEIVEKVRTLL